MHWLCVFGLFVVACGLFCKPPAAVAGLIMMDYAHSVGLFPWRHFVTGIYSTYEGHNYTLIPKKIRIHPCLCTYRCWLRYKLQCGRHGNAQGEKYAIRLQICPKQKRNETLLSPAVHQQASGNGSSRHASISRAGPPYQLPPRRGFDTLA
jgi:hypothetical protein